MVLTKLPERLPKAKSNSPAPANGRDQLRQCLTQKAMRLQRRCPSQAANGLLKGNCNWRKRLSLTQSKLPRNVAAAGPRKLLRKVRSEWTQVRQI